MKPAQPADDPDREKPEDTESDPLSPQGRPDVLQGTLDMLILRVLRLEPMHGWAISRRIHQVSHDVILVNQGSLYPSLHRLERKGWVRARWGTSDNNRRAKFYALTPLGSQQLVEETENWARLSEAVARVLEHA